MCVLRVCFNLSLEEMYKSFHCLSKQWSFRAWKCIYLYIYTWPKDGDVPWLKPLKFKGFVLHRKKKTKTNSKNPNQSEWSEIIIKGLFYFFLIIEYCPELQRITESLISVVDFLIQDDVAQGNISLFFKLLSYWQCFSCLCFLPWRQKSLSVFSLCDSWCTVLRTDAQPCAPVPLASS